MSKYSRTVSPRREQGDDKRELTPEAIARLMELRERVEARLAGAERDDRGQLRAGESTGDAIASFSGLRKLPIAGIDDVKGVS